MEDKPKTGRMKKILNSIRESPINYFSDLLICAMVVLWIADNLWETLIATIVTVSSIFLSFQAGYGCYDTSMWSSIGTNIAIPLSAGGAIWMVKNGVQHAIANRDGKQAHMDFPAINAEGQDDGNEKPIKQEKREDDEK